MRLRLDLSLQAVKRECIFSLTAASNGPNGTQWSLAERKRGG
jgi:hypothetical protein